MKLQAQVHKWALLFAELNNQVVGKTDVLLDQTICQQGKHNIGNTVSQWGKRVN